MYRELGRTGLMVSQLALGTVALGVDYGIDAPGEFGRPGEREAVYVVQAAADAGINLFDTAPAYGESERLLGQALVGRADCLVATKLTPPTKPGGERAHGRDLESAVMGSLEASLRALRRETLDIVQIHNATLEMMANTELMAVLERARLQGKLRYLGVSVYGTEAALAAVQSGQYDQVQVAYNVLDQRMAAAVFPMAIRNGVGVVTRSALLKGVLTAKCEWLPPELEPLRQAAERAKDVLAGSWTAMTQAAVRYCLSAPEVASVLVGVRNPHELAQALAAADQGPLPPDVLARAVGLALSDDRLLNPSHWNVA